MADLNWQTVAASIAGSGALTFLLRTWISERMKGSIQAEYAVQLETVKAQLKSAADLQLAVHSADLKRNADVEQEKLRAQLAATASERNTLLAALTTRRFDAIADVHAALLRFHGALANMTAPIRLDGTDESALVQAVASASQALNETFVARQIFLTEATARKVSEIRQMLVSSGNLFHFGVTRNQEADRFAKWLEIDAKLSGPVAVAIDDLARELRTLMGDSEQSQRWPLARVVL
jgi:hypothetical protein